MKLRSTLLLIAAGAGLVLAAMSRTWVDVPAPGDLTIKTVTTHVSGNDLLGLPRALALVAVAGVLALVATRGLARVAIGVLIALAGAGAAIDLLAFDRANLAVLGAGHASGGCKPASGEHSCFEIFFLPDGTQTHQVWLWIALAGALLIAAAGAVAARRGRGWEGMSARYERSGPPPGDAPPTDKGVWDQLDAGDDPTA